MRQPVLLLTLIFCLLIIGCGDIPECDEKEVKATLKEIVERNLKALSIDDASVNIDMIRTISKRKTDCECSALVEIESNDFGSYTEQINYKVEIPDKKDGTFIVVIQ